jgi:aryl-alcohol dehydrogenase-like predicted oxidoreductase
MAACHALVAREPPIDEELRLAAHGRLAREGDARAFDALARDLEEQKLSMSARYALLGMALTYPESLRRDLDVDDVDLDIDARPRARPEAREAKPAPIDVERRPLGKTGIHVAPLGISGAHDLPASQLARARDAGVNLFFWEPEYRSLESFVTTAARKEDLVLTCGTYEADAKTIERDIDRALRRLRIDTIGVMLLFWVRSPARLSDEAYGALVRAKEKGKVRAIGFSTHLRELAADAIRERAWDVVMARHSAAHPALETTLLPVARERGVGVIAFSALVYGRMLASHAFSAADCYRYPLTQPGVSVCLSAPRRQRELEENLAVLRKPTLDRETETRLRQHGEHVRAENRAFMSLVRAPS